MSPIERRHYLLCPVCAEPIPLPRLSLLGIFSGQQSQPTDKWPLTFLCIPRARLSECLARDIQFGPVGKPDRSLQSSFLRIEAECVREGCGKHHAIYSWFYTAEPSLGIADALLRATPRLQCGGHVAEFVAEKVRVPRCHSCRKSSGDSPQLTLRNEGIPVVCRSQESSAASWFQSRSESTVCQVCYCHCKVHKANHGGICRMTDRVYSNYDRGR